MVIKEMLPSAVMFAPKFGVFSGIDRALSRRLPHLDRVLNINDKQPQTRPLVT